MFDLVNFRIDVDVNPIDLALRPSLVSAQSSLRDRPPSFLVRQRFSTELLQNGTVSSVLTLSK